MSAYTSLLLSCCIVLVAYVSDSAIFLFKSKLLLCLADNAAHALLAGLTWLHVCICSQWHVDDAYQYKAMCMEVLMACICGSLLDIDHFITAGSLTLHAATHLSHRPFGHTVLFIIFISVCV